MPGLVNALPVAAVAAVVIVRQFRIGRVERDRRRWMLPGILTRRVRSLEPAPAPSPAPAYGADASRSRRKERV